MQLQTFEVSYQPAAYTQRTAYNERQSKIIITTGFPLYFGIEFQGPRSWIFKDRFSTEVYSMHSITAI